MRDIFTGNTTEEELILSYTDKTVAITIGKDRYVFELELLRDLVKTGMLLETIRADITRALQYNPYQCPQCGERFDCDDASCDNLEEVLCDSCIKHEHICYSRSVNPNG